MSAWQILGLITICAILSLAVWSVYAAACPLNPPDDEEEEPMKTTIEKPEQPTELQKFFMSKTPLSDALPRTWETRTMFASFATVPLSDCRAIEQRLNECVIALRSTEKLFADNSAIGRLINAAIANARKPLP